MRPQGQCPGPFGASRPEVGLQGCHRLQRQTWPHKLDRRSGRGTHLERATLHSTGASSRLSVVTLKIKRYTCKVRVHAHPRAGVLLSSVEHATHGQWGGQVRLGQEQNPQPHGVTLASSQWEQSPLLDKPAGSSGRVQSGPGQSPLQAGSMAEMEEEGPGSAEIPHSVH